jgi:hypothetical protein
VDRYTVARDSRVAYSGGPGGIQHQPNAQEQAAMHEQHVGRTSLQTQHVNAAMSDHSNYFNSNHGRPSSVAVARPLAPASHGMPNSTREGQPGSFNNRGGSNAQYGAQPHSNQQPNQGYQNRDMQSRPAPQYQPRNNPSNESRPAPREESRPAPAPKEQHQSKPEPKEHKDR